MIYKKVIIMKLFSSLLLLLLLLFIIIVDWNKYICCYVLLRVERDAAGLNVLGNQLLCKFARFGCKYG